MRTRSGWETAPTGHQETSSHAMSFGFAPIGACICKRYLRMWCSIFFARIFEILWFTFSITFCILMTPDFGPDLLNAIKDFIDFRVIEVPFNFAVWHLITTKESVGADAIKWNRFAIAVKERRWLVVYAFAGKETHWQVWQLSPQLRMRFRDALAFKVHQFFNALCAFIAFVEKTEGLVGIIG